MKTDQVVTTFIKTLKYARHCVRIRERKNKIGLWSQEACSLVEKRDLDMKNILYKGMDISSGSDG